MASEDTKKEKKAAAKAAVPKAKSKSESKPPMDLSSYTASSKKKRRMFPSLAAVGRTVAVKATVLELEALAELRDTLEETKLSSQDIDTLRKIAQV